MPAFLKFHLELRPVFLLTSSWFLMEVLVSWHGGRGVNKRKTIRRKLLVAVIILASVIGALGYSSFRGAYAYRDLAVVLSQRAAEFPVAEELTREIDELQHRIERTNQLANSTGQVSILRRDYDIYSEHQRFREQLMTVRSCLSRYRIQLNSAVLDDPLLSDRSEELEKVEEIEKHLSHISNHHSDIALLRDEEAESRLQELQQVSNLAHSLPTFLHDRMRSFRDEVRMRYRTWIAISWSSSIFTAILLIGLCIYVRRAVVLPFKSLLASSRHVASGDFSTRIEIDSEDELSELAAAINMGTESFLRIQRNLHDQVVERSREVIRNEQLASVGFLAAGVAHEINNPLASIAWSAEALESRLHNILHSVASEPNAAESQPDLNTLRNYLRRIQDEAFRCKGITEKLLDFSRLGQFQKKQEVDLDQLIRDVVEMVQHLGQYRNRRIETKLCGEASIWASPQEMKQVILNLVTNALDSLPEENTFGVVTIETQPGRDQVAMIVTDNGCGMTEEVKNHLFEPFFTRRRDGRGTGLGLPITSRIIADHGGRILSHSDGVGKGSRFEVMLPTKESHAVHDRQLQAA